MFADWPIARRIAASSVVALAVGVLLATLFNGLSNNYPIRLGQVVACILAAIVVIGLVVSSITMRLADYSWLFRNELTGALAGMFRVRQLTQDDSHVICREDQVVDEVNLALRLVMRQFEPFGFAPRFNLEARQVAEPQQQIVDSVHRSRMETRRQILQLLLERVENRFVEQIT